VVIDRATLVPGDPHALLSSQAGGRPPASDHSASAYVAFFDRINDSTARSRKVLGEDIVAVRVEPVSDLGEVRAHGMRTQICTSTAHTRVVADQHWTPTVRALQTLDDRTVRRHRPTYPSGAWPAFPHS
jgi:hypothetical protein